MATHNVQGRWAGAVQRTVRRAARRVTCSVLAAPAADNARFYCAAGLPFVMGTTGGDRAQLLEDVKASNNYAVIAPNMGKQVGPYSPSTGQEPCGCLEVGAEIWMLDGVCPRPSTNNAPHSAARTPGPPQIVAFQSMMESMAQRFPGCFSGYTLKVVESHQRTKVDTSGTAKAVVASFKDMGIDFEEVRHTAPSCGINHLVVAAQ